MSRTRKMALGAAGLALVAWALEAAALSAGTARGVPLIGRALQVSIPVSWERGEAPPCVRAEFLQGDSPGGPLRSRLETTGEGSGVVRLSSSQPVQEPAVTVQLSLGCAQPYTREYVLLAELPDEAREAQQGVAERAGAPPVAMAPLALAAAPSLGATAPPSAAPTRAARASTERPGAQGAGPHPAARPRRAASEQRASAAAGRREAAPAPARASAEPAPPSGPRLKLEAIDLAIDEAPVLRMSTGLSQPPAAGAGARTDAPGVWQALNTSPEQAAAQTEAARALETELRAMRLQVQRYGADTRVLTERLEKVSSERDLILNVLAGFLFLLGSGFIYLLWLRTRESAARRIWWEQGQAGGAGAVAPMRAEEAHATAAVAAAQAVATAKSSAPVAPEPAQREAEAATVDSELIELPDFLELDHSRVPTAEELLGLKERADFFLAVGQPEKAVHLMESQLHEHTGSSPYLWLDLLDLCRRLERRDDYERLRQAFQKLFSARLPGFDEAVPESGGLVDHPRALSRILLLWGSPRVLKVIEESLLEQARPGSITFDLEASRDLLLLYGVASEVLEADESHPGDFGALFPQTMVAGLQSAAPPSTEPVPLAALDDPRPRAPGRLPDILLGDPRPRAPGPLPDILLGDPGAPLIADDFDFLLPSRDAGRPWRS